MSEYDLKLLYGPNEIKERISVLGKHLDSHYRGKNPLLVAILKGSYMFMADLSRAMDEAHEIDFVATAAYAGTTPLPGNVRLTKDMDLDIAGRHVLIVEDIVDSGRTLSRICELFRARRPASLEVVTLLDKPERRVVEVPVMISGFCVPDQFVVGYGLDLAEQFRHLDGIYTCSHSEGAEADPGKKSRAVRLTEN